ncbi:MAG: hypothetical protein H0T62_07360 [Parachlamydiaceae bacterium]|nr:hypothetical protein [Parachlamydiaceae bacterium]
MLVFFQNDFDVYIGIGVGNWECEGKLRTMILIPRIISDDSYCDIKIACHEDSTLSIVKEALAGWSTPQKNGFGENAAGYWINKSTAEDLYLVWDDGFKRHPERSAKLFKTFSTLIHHYSASAIHFLSQWHEAQYQAELKIGKERGFDLSLIEKKKSVFTYEVIPIKS